MCISLSTKKGPSGLNIKSEEDLIKQLDETPPAIYLLDEKSKGWKETPKVLILPTQLNFMPKEIRCFFSEFKNESAEASYFVRSLWLVLD